MLWADPTAPDAQATFVSLGEALVDGGMWYYLVLGEDVRTRGGGAFAGALQIPLVSIRSPWGQVPSHDWTYADRLNRSGGTDRYSEWTLTTHQQEDLRQNMDTALRALVAWVDGGVRPTWPTAP